MNNQERGLAITGLSIVVALVLGYFGLRPLLDSYHQNVLRSQALAAQINDLQSRKSQLANLQQQLAKYKGKIDELAVAVPPAPDYPELLVQLSALADKGQVTVSSVLPGRAAPTNSGGIPVTVTVRGSYPQLLSFIQAVEANLRPVTVNSMALISASNNSPTGQAQPLTATIQMTFAQATPTGGNQ